MRRSLNKDDPEGEILRILRTDVFQPHELDLSQG